MSVSVAKWRHFFACLYSDSSCPTLTLLQSRREETVHIPEVRTLKWNREANEVEIEEKK
jgi:hypothetical protein